MRMSTKNVNFWDLVSQVKKGRQRKYVLRNIKADTTMLVSEITRAVNAEIKQNKDGKEIRLRDVSRSLKWLAENNLVKCLNPSSEHGVSGILYRLTNAGLKVKKEL